MPPNQIETDRFEYMRQREATVAQLNAWGDDRWELVSVTVVLNIEYFYLKRRVLLHRQDD
jgi:hypothetical protein